ncbi:uncharacterized protein EV420DRAFT_1635001 [Desarmillaria tabescens]|uniref:Uncharacterized protein n=1 Tax=Armillaria tabescens TaxID=1929756 RepID=A0AA39NLM9_ARMTA|nr:uncharacterized protein EV420DRAFT_1635001 [Desarmillaria tabescens]KAK0467738.1 hypothetical protein EV420DRAFT_1635001 [Desarmillaria tabescens]
MADVKIYLKPRPISALYGHCNYIPNIYIPYKRCSEFKYGPFLADYGAVPSDATEEYTIHSPSLSAQLAVFHNETLPSLQADIPNPNKTSRSSWSSLLELARSKLAGIVDFRTDAPDPLTDSSFNTARWWYRLVFSILSRDDRELRDNDDTEVQILVSAYMYDAIFSLSVIWANFREEMLQLTDPVSPAYLPSGYGNNSGFLTLLSTQVYTIVPALYPADTTSNHDYNSPLSQSSDTVDFPSISHTGDGLTDKTSFRLRRRNYVTIIE